MNFSQRMPCTHIVNHICRLEVIAARFVFHHCHHVCDAAHPAIPAPVNKKCWRATLLTALSKTRHRQNGYNTRGRGLDHLPRSSSSGKPHLRALQEVLHSWMGMPTQRSVVTVLDEPTLTPCSGHWHGWWHLNP